MDAAEADFDAKLYKASGDLIPELRTKLPKLIWHDGDSRTRLRTHVLVSKCEELRSLLDRFQEWPQLLDPVLAFVAQDIVDGFLTFVTTCPEKYGAISPAGHLAVPLPCALSRLLYTLCKVRGYKVVLRLLNNEPRYIEPMLSCIRRWNSSSAGDQFTDLTWEIEYIMYLWLSHLMLAPFELSTLSTSNVPNIRPDLQKLSTDVGEVAKDVLSIAFESIGSPSKERESAVLLLIRLALRRDMQAVNLPARLAAHSIDVLLNSKDRDPSIYESLGHLSLLYAITNLGSDSEVAPFLKNVHQAVSTLASSELPHHLSVRDAAPARKLLVKILRACMTHAVKLKDTSLAFDHDLVNSMLEASVQHLLDALGDKDSPVRMAASKALSMIALSLDDSMSAEIVEAVLGCLSENVLLNDPKTGQVMAKTDVSFEQAMQMKRNLSAVDALRWHGLMLTLGHVLFRRSPPPYQLPDIIEALLLGLEFEQRSNVGTSIGIGVRDGACFGIWALARKYSTQELEAISATDISGTRKDEEGHSQSALQLIAIRLIMSSCLDPSGNIRRGSSAALQELIGRHPDTIVEGIPVVQVVDYQAVARRSRAMMDVAVQAAALSPTYHEPFLDALIDWRGARAADADSRRWTAEALRHLCVSSPLSRRLGLLQQLMSDLQALKPRNLGITAGARHGLLLCSAAVIRSISKLAQSEINSTLEKVQDYDISLVFGNLEGRATVDLEAVMEGVANLLRGIAVLMSQGSGAHTDYSISWVEKVLPILNRCLLASEKETVAESGAKAVEVVFALATDDRKRVLIATWLDTKKQKPSEIFSRGRLKTLAALHPQLSFDRTLQIEVENHLQRAVQCEQSIETKINAMRSLQDLMEGTSIADSKTCESLAGTLIAGLSDYTNDQRGDIGSLLRLQSLEVIEAYQNAILSENLRVNFMQCLLPHVVRLATEKLNKVRHRAWHCFKASWGSQVGDISLGADYQHLADVSSEAYFRSLMPLLQVEGLEQQLLKGLSSSIGGGTEDICRSCTSALVTWTLGLDTATRTSLVNRVTLSLIQYLYGLADREDRDVVPALELVSFVIEQELVSETALAGSFDTKSGIWGPLQDLHASNVSMERLGALMKVYQALTRISPLRKIALDKLTRQLLHRYPKIRNGAADAMCTISSDVDFFRCDWNAPSGANKAVVLELRKSLNIGITAKG